MVRRLIRIAFELLVFVAPNLLLGQGEESHRHVTLSIGAGFTTRTGSIVSDIDNGGNYELNGGYFFNRHLGITGNFLFSEAGITRSALNALNQPNGMARIYAVTADPTVRQLLGRGFVAYALAGGGYVVRDLLFMKPILVRFSSTHMPFMLIPGFASNGSIVSNSAGFDLGAGLNMPSPWKGAKVFLEVRYLKGFTSNLNTSVVPATVGIRW